MFTATYRVARVFVVRQRTTGCCSAISSRIANKKAKTFFISASTFWNSL
jgi:hypothetical protein